MLPIPPVNSVPKKPAQAPTKALDVVAIAGSKTTEGPPTAVVAPVERSERLRRFDARRTSQGPTPLEASLQAKPEPEANAAPASKTVRRIEIDSATNRVIFQAISEATGEVVSQVPSEAQLRIREYTKADAAAKLASAEARRA